MFSSDSISSIIGDIIRLLSFPFPTALSYVVKFPLKYASISLLSDFIIGTYISIWRFELFGPSRNFFRYYDLCWLLTVRCYSANDTAVRPHGISHNSFLVYLPDLPFELTFAFRASLSFVSLPTQWALVSGFCPSGYDFAIASSLPHLTMWNLQVAIGFVGNYAPLDFHHRIMTCPSYRKNAAIWDGCVYG